MKLYHFEPIKKTKKNKIPLLIVYALVNRPYMLDLDEERSLIKKLLEAGQDVYLVDWGYPTREDIYITLSDYINGYINDCVEIVKEASKQKSINLLGVCQGGTFSTIYTAIYPEKIKNLVLLVTPIDFSVKEGLLFTWAKNLPIDSIVDAFGLVPGSFMNAGFTILKPYSLMVDKYLGLVESGDSVESISNFLRMEKWIFDSPGQVGEAFREFLTYMFKENRLIKGKLEIGGKKVDLKNIKCPVLNIYGTNDHLVPHKSSSALKKYIGSVDKENKEYKLGHIGIFVSKRSQKEVAPHINEWLNNHIV